MKRDEIGQSMRPVLALTFAWEVLVPVTPFSGVLGQDMFQSKVVKDEFLAAVADQ